ncbi:hypothetical protein ACQQ2N_03275 [Dokdonella sp. MW10]|uniref:hypothetical protein n=1 Tax=Dokdonella sp. MW10 TaxID=2992926 RepID=UPI003F7E495B
MESQIQLAECEESGGAVYVGLRVIKVISERKVPIKKLKRYLRLYARQGTGLYPKVLALSPRTLQLLLKRKCDLFVPL